jgi:uncharacterized protein
MNKTGFEVYKDKKGHFRWKLVAKNGENVAEGGEGFVDKRHAMNAVRKLKVWASTDIITDKTVAVKANKPVTKK